MRRHSAGTRQISPDPVYGDVRVQKFINTLLRNGKKSGAESVFYNSMKIIEAKAKADPLKLFQKAMENVRPIVEVRSKRIGGATYQVPREVAEPRSYAVATRWIITFAKGRKGKSMSEKLAAELMEAAHGQGGAIKKKEDTHKMAEANRAFAHYR